LKGAFKDSPVMTNAKLNREVGAEQRKLLKQWMGPGAQGPRKAMGSALPEGLTADTLRAFAAIARRQIDARLDTVGTQAARLKSIEDALQRLG
jgi:hypothetical protein